MIEELNMIYDELTSSNVKKIEHFETELSKIRAGKGFAINAFWCYG